MEWLVGGCTLWASVGDRFGPDLAAAGDVELL
jgi:hypothetical protein